MFCDLVDSTGIAARLDAEEWRDLVGAYLDAASTAVVEMGGKVAKKLGDGLMALFGYPSGGSPFVPGPAQNEPMAIVVGHPACNSLLMCP
jgi:class 3 adenylate cyclase